MQYSRGFSKSKYYTALNTKNRFKILFLPHGGKWLAEEMCQMNSLILRKCLSTLLPKQHIFLSYQGQKLRQNMSR